MGDQDIRGYRIAPSAIHGMGIIAARAYNEGAWIGIVVLFTPKGPVITPYLGKYVNHTYCPNSQLIKNGMQYDLVAMRYIEAGEEIAANYNNGPFFLEKAGQGFV
jgi:hypothetical protein